MKGNNTFIFNNSTMIEVMQHYFDNVFLKEKCKVFGFKRVNRPSMNDEYEIEIREFAEGEDVQE